MQIFLWKSNLLLLLTSQTDSLYWVSFIITLFVCLWYFLSSSFISFPRSFYGAEIITKFKVKEDFDNKNEFYTDSNGREIIKRVLNKRNDFVYDPTEEPVSGNYYPVTSRILIQDLKKDLEVAVLNDRSQGGTSLNAGEIELMVHFHI